MDPELRPPLVAIPSVRDTAHTFASYGSRERDVYRKLPFRQLHGTFTVVSLRVRWVPLYRFPTLSLRAFAMCAVFPCSDYSAQFDCLQGLGVSYGSPHFYSPPSLTSLGRVGTGDLCRYGVSPSPNRACTFQRTRLSILESLLSVGLRRLPAIYLLFEQTAFACPHS